MTILVILLVSISTAVSVTLVIRVNKLSQNVERQEKRRDDTLKKLLREELRDCLPALSQEAKETPQIDPARYAQQRVGILPPSQQQQVYELVRKLEREGH